MEHRCGSRQEVDWKVNINIRAAPEGVVRQGQVREVSLSGAFVMTPRGLFLTFGPLLYVALELVEADEIEADRIVEGHVVRHTSNGFAVEWNEFAPRTIQRLLAKKRSPMAGELRS